MANGYGTRNMGRGTSSYANDRPVLNDRAFSGGMVTRTRCLACGEPKHTNQSHPKCSRKLQQMYRRGEL